MPRQDVCAFCSSSEKTASTRELQRTADGSLVAHYRCMLYSPNVTQDSQEDTEGFDFNVESVRSEIRRGKKLKCTLCKKRGATIGCNVKSCKRTYHYLCLLKANGRTNSDEFVAYCAWHKNVETTNGPDQGAQQESPEEQEPQQESPEEQEPQQESPEEQEPQQQSLSPASLHDMAADSPSAGGARGSGWLLSQSSADEGEEIQNQNPTLEDLLASHRRQSELMEQHGVMLARFVAAQQQGNSH
ncbi:uncharacterized protein ACNLHF_008927 [Anomaloglossus baeobatrachus]|uniref:uncharacterized protein LOC142292138 n=1 Tax=Anomaloglossus baeobatrachus TaxID=238106 RepID=UPI003F50295A